MEVISSENGYFASRPRRDVRLRFEASKYFNVFLRLIPLKRDVFLDLVKNLSFSDKLLVTYRSIL